MFYQSDVFPITGLPMSCPAGAASSHAYFCNDGTLLTNLKLLSDLMLLKHFACQKGDPAAALQARLPEVDQPADTPAADNPFASGTTAELIGNASAALAAPDDASEEPAKAGPDVLKTPDGDSKEQAKAGSPDAPEPRGAKIKAIKAPLKGGSKVKGAAKDKA